jgi:hypothetical protein
VSQSFLASINKKMENFSKWSRMSTYIESGSGGATSSGASFSRKLSETSSSGGVGVGGVNSQTYRDYRFGTGGMRTWGKSKFEKIRFELPKMQTGIGRCINGNILAVVPTPESLLFKPKYTPPQPIQQHNPRVETTGVWCQVGSVCKDGAGLPKIVQARQKGFIPDAQGTIHPADRGIATKS